MAGTVSLSGKREFRGGTAFFLALASGLIVANLYYAQPLAGMIGASLGLSPKSDGLIVTFTQLGYALGLIFIVPLGDLIENRLAIVGGMIASCAGLITAGLAGSPAIFLLAVSVTGFSSAVAQIVVPLASHFTAKENQGRVIGSIMSGLFLGIMLARPVSSLVGGLFGWRAIFFSSAIAMACLALASSFALPTRKPQRTVSYPQLLGSLATLLKTTPILRRRAFYHACLFGAFSVFWTTVPMFLMSPAIGLSQQKIAIFALIAVAGAIASPLAGRLADRGYTRVATVAAMALVGAAFCLSFLGGGSVGWKIVGLGAGAFILDFGVSGNLVLGQRAIFQLGAEIRSRLNSLYMTSFFLAGALCSAAGGWAYASYGWEGSQAIGIGLALLGLVVAIVECARPPLAR